MNDVMQGFTGRSLELRAPGVGHRNKGHLGNRLERNTENFCDFLFMWEVQ